MLDPATVPVTEEERTIALAMRATAIETIYRLMPERELLNEARTLRQPWIEATSTMSEKAVREIASASLRRVMGEAPWNRLDSEVGDRADQKTS